MDAREIIRRSIRGFFIIFAMGVVGYTVFAWFLSPERVDGLFYGDVAMLLFIAVATSQALWIFYSKEELTHKQFSRRRVVHFLLVQGIAISGTSLIIYGRELTWEVPHITGVILMIASVCVIYATVTLVDSFNFKKLTDDINKRLKERYGD